MAISKDDVVGFVRDEVDNFFKSTSSPITGAVLAERVRIKFPGLDFQTIGVEKLGDLVRAAQDRGWVIRNPNVKHLEILPKGQSFGAAIYTPQESTDMYIRPDAWQAFGMLHPGKLIRFDKVAAQFFVLEKTAAVQPESIDVVTPTNDAHREWIEIFTRENAIEYAEISKSSPTVLKDFSQWIHDNAVNMVPNWKKFRARKVTEAIQHWGGENGISVQEMLSPVRPMYSVPASGSNEDDIRRAVLNCVSDMMLPELEQISLPVRLVVKYFKPR